MVTGDSLEFKRESDNRGIDSTIMLRARDCPWDCWVEISLLNSFGQPFSGYNSFKFANVMSKGFFTFDPAVHTRYWSNHLVQWRNL